MGFSGSPAQYAHRHIPGSAFLNDFYPGLRSSITGISTGLAAGGGRAQGSREGLPEVRAGSRDPRRRNQAWVLSLDLRSESGARQAVATIVATARRRWRHEWNRQCDRLVATIVVTACPLPESDIKETPAGDAARSPSEKHLRLS
jgi:hypothetical protein